MSASLGVERFLEKYPQYQGKFTLVQIGAPSRTDMKRYHDFLLEVEAESERINRPLCERKMASYSFPQLAP